MTTRLERKLQEVWQCKSECKNNFVYVDKGKIKQEMRL